MNGGLDLLRQVVIAALVAVLTVAVYDRYRPAPPVPLATVDLAGIVDTFVSQNRKLAGDSAALETKVKAFTEGLDAAADRVSRRSGLVLLSKQAVVAGAPDVTAQFKAVLAEEGGRKDASR